MWSACCLLNSLTAFGLNDVCDALRHHAARLFAIRATTVPSRNGLSHANKTRNADMMEALFWKMLDHLQQQFPGFGPSGRYKGLPRRFKKTIHSIDSSTIALVDPADLRFGPVHFVPGLVAALGTRSQQTSDTLATLVGSVAICAAAFSYMAVRLAS